MTWILRPTITRNGASYELPRPILTLQVYNRWDFAQFKIPLAEGDVLHGRSIDGVDILIRGQVGTHAGVLQPGEIDMLLSLEELRTALHSSDPESMYRLGLYRDVAASTERYFDACTTKRFDYDLSERSLFEYSLLIHAADPLLHIGGT